MRRKQMIAVIEAAAGLDYMEWQLLVQLIETEFERARNRAIFAEGNVGAAAVRLEIELGMLDESFPVE